MPDTEPKYRTVVKPGVALDRKGRRTLADQMAERLRDDILDGRLKAGDVLPSIDALAAEAGVSANVPRRALRKLAEEGLVSPRRGVGSVVAERTRERNAPGVLCCGPFEGGGLYFDDLLASLRRRLVRAGMRFEVASVRGSRGRKDYSSVEEMLRRPWSLILYWRDPSVRRLVAANGSPSVVIGDGVTRLPEARAVGAVDIRNSRALPAFISACVRKGVKEVVQFTAESDRYNAAESFRVAEIAVRSVRIPACESPEGYVRAGLKAVLAFLDSRRTLPPVIFFSEDLVAQGGLIALALRGVRVPDDVGVVALSNRGVGPVWERPLARLETDPAEQGREIARAVLGYMKKGSFPDCLRLGSVWKPGATF